MTQFKKGQRVRWTGNYDSTVAGKSAVGQLGTITDPDYHGTTMVEVKWDDPKHATNHDLGTGIFRGNLEVVEDKFVVGERVRVTNAKLRSHYNKVGTVASHIGDTVRVALDGDRQTRHFYPTSLVKEPTTVAKTKTKNFITLVRESVASVSATGANPKDAAVAAYGIAAEFTRLGEAAKKKAKKGLLDLGLITEAELSPGTEIVYDSATFTLSTETKSASSRIDPSLVGPALLAEGISTAKATRILKAITVPTKAATSLKVQPK